MTTIEWLLSNLIAVLVCAATLMPMHERDGEEREEEGRGVPQLVGLMTKSVVTDSVVCPPTSWNS